MWKIDSLEFSFQLNGTFCFIIVLLIFKIENFIESTLSPKIPRTFYSVDVIIFSQTSVTVKECSFKFKSL